MGVEV